MPRFNLFKSFNLSNTSPRGQPHEPPHSIDRRNDHPRTLKKRVKGVHERGRRKPSTEQDFCWPREPITTIPNAWATCSEIEPADDYSSRNTIPSVHRESQDMEDVSMSIPRSAFYDAENISLSRHEYVSQEQIGKVQSEQRPVVYPRRYNLDRGTMVSTSEWPPESRVIPESLHSVDENLNTPIYPLFRPAARRYEETKRDAEVIEPVIYEHEVWSVRSDEPDVYYYIIPGGLNVIFWGEDGEELRRFGKFGDSVNQPRRVSPTIVQDEYGNELYRTGDFGWSLDVDSDHSTHPSSRRVRRGPDKPNQRYDKKQRYQSLSSGLFSQSSSSPMTHSAISYASVPREAKNIILVDDQGQQIPLRTGGKSTPFVRRPRRIVKVED